MNIASTIIGLDIGTVRVGVSRALWPEGIPVPLTTITNDLSFMENLAKLINEEDVGLIVIGRPRGLNSQQTKQTNYVDELIETIKQVVKLPIYWQDEALTSVKAENELMARKKPFKKEDIDALSATYILEDFMLDHPKGKGIEL